MKFQHIDLRSLTKLKLNSSLVLGTFDGVHTGHRYLVKEAFKLNPHVTILLIYTNKKITKDHQTSGVLTTLDDRINLFQKLHVEEVLLLNLDEQLLALSPVEFINKILVPLAPKDIVIGEDFRFGHRALGTPVLLQKLGKNHFEVSIIPPMVIDSEKISTSLIKQELLAGNTFKARRLLGAYYRLTGLVTKGFGLGSKLGFPTANVALDPNYFLPRHGVYFVRVRYQDNFYFGMASLGYHPTVNEVNLPLLEVNIFDFKDDIYHQVLSVEFLRFIRPEVKFDSLDALVAKIEEDRAICYKYMNEGDF
jgi:riboflavin kinase/FMN adenylyltransferase